MRKFKTFFAGLCMFVFLASSISTYAQAPYKHSVGVTVGTFYGPSYKTFLTDKLALQLDLGVKLNTVTQKFAFLKMTWIAWDLELNPNIVYQAPIGSKGFSWFAGGGLSLGYAFSQMYEGETYYIDAGKFGVNAIGGVEYTFPSIPLSLQFDFRPGYGLLFDSEGTQSYFDWSIGIGARYVLK